MKDIEQHIKKTLEERKIEPSSSAWDRIESEISTKKKSIIWVWKYAAAVLIMGLATSIYLMNNKSPQDNTQTNIVKGEVKTSEKSPENSFKENQFIIQNQENSEMENRVVSTSKTIENTNLELDSKETLKILKKPNHKNSETKSETKKIIKIAENINQPQVENIEDPTTQKTIAVNKKSVDTARKNSGIKVNREKLLFYVENEDQIKKPSRIAFENNTLKIDLHD